VSKEARARIKINKLLEESGWRFIDSEHGKANILLEANTKLVQADVDAFGEDFEKSKKGFIDFLLLNAKGFPCAVLEAKSEDKAPLDGKEQARGYAQSQKVRFIILSNGNLHYFWDLEKGNPAVITSFPKPDSIEHLAGAKSNLIELSKEVVTSDYIVLTQNADYRNDPRWLDPTQQAAFIEENGLKFLRPYQLEAIVRLQESSQKGNNRYLFEMATGTGKTLLSAAVIKLFLRTKNAKRVLFLVDRLELEDQAWKNFVRYLKNDYTSVIYKENRNNWQKAEIVVTTIQSLSSENKYRTLFSPTDFDLIISDEAHRSIGGNSRAVFEYFIGYKLGLTATPKNYLRKLDPTKINENDPREWERRQLLDTYITFGCASGEPTFRYDLIKAVAEGYLVNPLIIDARTEITTQMLSKQGYAVMVNTEEGKEEEQKFFEKDYEKKFYSEKTNRIFCQTFLENALKDPISGEIGKSLIFCVSQNHASKVTQILNEYADKMYPGKYNSDFAVQVTSNVPDAQQFTINFSNNNLNGHTKFLESYKSSKSRVCVTVGMMTTGYDCEDILNLCLMRPVFSPTDFIQMKGRGTRKYIFNYVRKEGSIKEQTKVDKTKYKLFDFFAVCEYFEERFNYDEVLKLPPTRTYKEAGGGEGFGHDEQTVYVPDPIKTFTEKAVGEKGMRIDREFFASFENTIKNDPVNKANYAKGDIAAIEEKIKTELFGKPLAYYNEEKLSKAARVGRRLSLWEIIEKAFGGITRFKTKDELLEDEFANFVAINKPDNKHIVNLKNYFKAYITDKEVRDIITNKEYGRLATNPRITLEEFKDLNGWIDIVPAYVKDYVPIEKFAET
jgi:type I restriction enzyme, R subunit